MGRAPTVSPAWPLNVAIAAAIEAARVAGIPALSAPADGGDAIDLDAPAVYSGQVPEGTALTSAYIVLSNSQEGRRTGTFQRRATESVETIDVFTADTSKRSAVTIAGVLVRMLDGVDLALDGYGTVRGRCELVITVPDPSTRQYHAQLRYTATSLTPAAS